MKRSWYIFNILLVSLILKSWDQLPFCLEDHQDSKEFVDYNDQLQELYKIVWTYLKGITVSCVIVTNISYAHVTIIVLCMCVVSGIHYVQCTSILK